MDNLIHLRLGLDQVQVARTQIIGSLSSASALVQSGAGGSGTDYWIVVIGF